MSIQVTMVKTRETKGAVLYTEVGANGQPVPTVSDGKLGQQYIRKSALSEPYPESITITVEAAAAAAAPAPAKKGGLKAV